MYGTTRSVCTRWGARSSQGYQAAMQIFLETFICLGGKCLLRVSALFKDKATWPGIKHELCDLLKSMQYANWRWIILNWHAKFSRHVVSSDRAEKRLRVRRVLAGESTSGGIFDRLINAKFWRHSMLIFWTNIIREKWRRWNFQCHFSQADVPDILNIFLAILTV